MALQLSSVRRSCGSAVGSVKWNSGCSGRRGRVDVARCRRRCYPGSNPNIIYVFFQIEGCGIGDVAAGIV